MNYLIDTNVLSEIRKKDRCHPGVRRWWDTIDDDQVHLSVLSVGEIRRGIDLLRLRRDLKSAAKLERWFHGLMDEHRDRILPVDIAVAEEWGRLNVPDPVSTVDGLLAATAKVHGMTLVTRNVRHIDHTGVSHLNPFEA